MKSEKGMNVFTNRKIRKLDAALKDKVILVTGSSSGIGLEVARRIGKGGGTVLLVARSQEKLESAKQDVESLGGKAFVYSCNLSHEKERSQLIETILSQHEYIDVLINNAGRSIRRPVRHSFDRLHDFQRTMDLNYFGCLHLILGFLPTMKKRKSGQIINVSTMGCQVLTPRFSAYIASKSALDAVSRCIAAEVTHHNVNISTIYMPLVRTPMIAPSKIYDRVPAMSPEKAALMVLAPLVTHQAKVSTLLGTFAELANDISPKSVESIMNLGYRLVPDKIKS